MPPVYPPSPPRYPPSSSDITTEYNDMGVGINPLGSKGYCFSPNGYGYSYNSSTHDSYPQYAPPPSFKFAPRRPNLPRYDFGDEEDDEAILSMKIPPAIPIPLTPNSQQKSLPENDRNLCCPLMGPIIPFLGTASLKEVGSSSFMSHDVFIAWRVVSLLLSMSTLVITSATEIRFLAYVQGAALLFSCFVHILLLRRAFLYRHNRDDTASVTEKIHAFGWDVFVFQSAIHLCFIVAITYSAFYIFIPGYLFVGVEYVGSPSSYMLLAVTILHLVDITVSPLTFRLPFVLPTTLYSIILCLISSKLLAISHQGGSLLAFSLTQCNFLCVFIFFIPLLLPRFVVRGSEYPFSGWVILVVGAGGLVSGVCLTVVSRGLYMTYHKSCLDASDTRDLAVVQKSRCEV